MDGLPVRSAPGTGAFAVVGPVGTLLGRPGADVDVDNVAVPRWEDVGVPVAPLSGAAVQPAHPKTTKTSAAANRPSPARVGLRLVTGSS